MKEVIPASMLPVLLLSLLLLGSCGVPFIRPKQTNAQWVMVQPSHYRYADYDMELEFKTLSLQFAWRFKNKSMVDLVIDHRNTSLRIEGDPMAYTLWGEPVGKQPNLPVITIKPDRFFETTYPVQFRSPLYPFKTSPEVTLHFTALWKGRPAHYTIAFPVEVVEEKPDEEQP